MEGRHLNFYKHYLGDYDGATAHLSWDEDMAYTRLLRAYYRREKPISGEEAYRLARASSKAQKAAVDSVLREFFEMRGPDWHNKRADEEIVAYSIKAGMNRENGKLGGRPKPTNNPDGSPDAPQYGLKNGTQHEPTNNLIQIPEPDNSNSKAMSGKPDVSSSWRRVNGELRLQALEILTFLNEKTGRNYRPVKANIGMIEARLKEGATVEELRAVVAKKCREWTGNETMQIYLRPATLFNSTKFAQYQGELRAVS